MDALRVLVADDEPDLLATLAEELEQAGAKVTRASSGGELLDVLADQGPFDLVITDVSMPWMSGLQVMHSERWSGLRTPVIVMTGLTEETVGEAVRALGEKAALLLKPFDFQALEAAIIKVTSRGIVPGEGSRTPLQSPP